MSGSRRFLARLEPNLTAASCAARRQSRPGYWTPWRVWLMKEKIAMLTSPDPKVALCRSMARGWRLRAGRPQGVPRPWGQAGSRGNWTRRTKRAGTEEFRSAVRSRPMPEAGRQQARPRLFKPLSYGRNIVCERRGAQCSQRGQHDNCCGPCRLTDTAISKGRGCVAASWRSRMYRHNLARPDLRGDAAGEMIWPALRPWCWGKPLTVGRQGAL